MRCLLFRMGDFYEMFGEDAERRRRPAGPDPDLARQGRRRRADGGVSPPGSRLATWPRSSRPACARPSASRWKIREIAKGLVKRDVVRVVTPGTLTDDELLDPRTANYLAAVVEVGGKLGLAWVELSTGRFSLTGLLRTELVDEIARLNPAEILISELSLDAPWVRHAPRPVGDAAHGPPVVGFPARAGAQDALRAVQDDDAGRLRHRRPQPGGPGGRRADGLPARDAEDVAGPHHAADPLSPRRHPGARRDDPAQPRAGAHPPRREARRIAPERDRLLGDADGRAAAVRVAHVAADVARPDRRAARRGRGAVQPVGPARRPADACSASRTTWSGWRRGSAPAGRRRATWSPWPGRSPSCPRSRPGSPPGSRSGSTSSRRPSSSARRSAPRSRPPWSTTRRWRSRKGA